MVPVGLLVCLFSGVVRADDGDDTLQFYLSKSDVVARGEFTSGLIDFNDEAGVINHVGDFKISQLIKGKPLGKRRVGGTINVYIVRFELQPEDRLPELKKGGKCILFLKHNERQTPPYRTSDMWFGVQPASPTLAAALFKLAEAKARAKDKKRD